MVGFARAEGNKMSGVAVSCNGLTKYYAKNVAVQQLTLSVAEGNVLALLGPSGCGKTTTLRLIAGFERPDVGTVEIAGSIVSSPKEVLVPEKRNVGMMFQEYALFPHMTVRENIAYGLARDSQQSYRVQEVLTLANLSGLEEQMPHQLSGGQQQRVALARALAPKPKVLLLDEPFSNLDAVLRSQIRQETKDILRKCEATVVLVTHSREEALEIGDSIAIMNQGRVEQSDTPERIFHLPMTQFVANFIGTADFLEASVTGDNLVTEIGQCNIPNGLKGYENIDIMIRPENVKIDPTDSGRGVIVQRVFNGAFYLYTIRLDSGTVIRCEEPYTKDYREGSRVNIEFKENYQPLCFFNGIRCS